MSSPTQNNQQTQVAAPNTVLAARPLSPRLSIYRWLPTMIASIMHRASGVFLVLMMPLAFWLLLTMSHSQVDYIYGVAWLRSHVGTFLLWLTFVALFYHFCNGIRFLCLDMGWGESRTMMKYSARGVLLLTILVAVVLGVMI